MGKVHMRQRNVDVERVLPIYTAKEISDLHNRVDFAANVLSVTDGMEKEEGTETHLQSALNHQQQYGTTGDEVIPIPEVTDITIDYERFYKSIELMPPKSLIRPQNVSFETSPPDYDMDSDDERWLADQTVPESSSRITCEQLEDAIDRLETNSPIYPLQRDEAIPLLRLLDGDKAERIYEYWIRKRGRLGHPLILHCKQDKRDGSTVGDPYVAFRRRAEKMQTRKNRKNDELSFEKMVKLRRDFGKLLVVLELVKKREEMKQQVATNFASVIDCRVKSQDWSTNQYKNTLKRLRARNRALKAAKTETIKKPPPPPVAERSVAELANDAIDDQFQFRRMHRSAHYHSHLPQPIDTNPWSAESPFSHPYFRRNLTSFNLNGSNYLAGFASCRIGRGGRRILSRVPPPPPPQQPALPPLLRSGLCWDDLVECESTELLSFIHSKELLHFVPSEIEEPSRPPSSSSYTASAHAPSSVGPSQPSPIESSVAGPGHLSYRSGVRPGVLPLTPTPPPQPQSTAVPSFFVPPAALMNRAPPTTHLIPLNYQSMNGGGGFNSNYATSAASSTNYNNTIVVSSLNNSKIQSRAAASHLPIDHCHYTMAPPSTTAAHQHHAQPHHHHFSNNLLPNGATATTFLLNKFPFDLSSIQHHHNAAGGGLGPPQPPNHHKMRNVFHHNGVT